MRRWHTEPTIGDQSVADHSWGVVMLVGWLTNWRRPYLLIHAATHDIGEHATGDVPAQVKWASPEITKVVEELELREHRRLSLPAFVFDTDDALVIKLADTLDAMHYCLEAMRRGEKRARVPFDRMVERIKSRADGGGSATAPEYLLRASVLLQQMTQEAEQL